jgi:hypothetical protein
VGCGWALQSAEWLADSVSGALEGSDSLDAGLKRYRRRHTRRLRGHAAMIYDYAGGRKLNAPERLLFSAATHDDGLAAVMEAFGSRSIGPGRMMMSGMPRALRAVARRSLSRRRAGGPGSVPVSTAAGGSSSRAVR